MNWSFDSKHLFFTTCAVSSIEEVAIVLCYCSVFEKLIVSLKSLIEVLIKFFDVLKLEPGSSKVKTHNARLET